MNTRQDKARNFKSAKESRQVTNHAHNHPTIAANREKTARNETERAQEFAKDFYERHGKAMSELAHE